MSLENRPSTKLLSWIIITLYSSPTKSHRWVATIWEARTLRGSHHASSYHLGSRDLFGSIGSLDQLLPGHFCPFPGKNLVNKAVRLVLVHRNAVKMILGLDCFLDFLITLLGHKDLVEDVLRAWTLLFWNAFIIVIFHHYLFVPFLFLVLVAYGFEELENRRKVTLLNFVV